MLKISRISIIVLITMVCIAYIQPQFRKLFVERVYTPQVNYSSVLKKFLIADYNQEPEKRYFDEDGKHYNKVKYQMLLPMMYFRDLAIWNRLPKEIDGVEITPLKVERSRQFTYVKNSDFKAPVINLYPMYESASIFSQIEEPSSMFRINSKMEFIDADTNKVEDKKSELFTKALKDKGFGFPAKQFFGNPNPRKSFDEGYFVVDNTNKVFHIKMQRGKPFVADTGVQPESGVKYIVFEEHPRREYYGVMFTNNNEIYLITYDNYKLLKLPVDNFDSETMSFFMMTDLIKRTIEIREPYQTRCIVTDTNYNKIDTHITKIERYDDKAEKYSNFIFPLTIIRSTGGSSFVDFNFEYHKSGLLSAILCVFIMIGFIIKKGCKIGDHAADIIITAVAGIPALGAFLAVGAFKKGDVS